MRPGAADTRASPAPSLHRLTPRGLTPGGLTLPLEATLALALVTVLAACGDDESAPLGPGPIVAIEILGVTNNGLTLAAGASQEIEVGGVDSQGRDNEDAEISAATSNAAVATVTGGAAHAGRVRLAHTEFEVNAIAPGSATITFEEEATGVAANLSVTVTP